MKLKVFTLVMAIMVMLTNFSFAAEIAKGKTIRLETFTGSVEVKSGSGKDVSVYEKMRVFDGYTIKTLGSSEVYLSLDDTKAVKLGNNTEVKVKKSWFSNKIIVISGELFFNVTKPLESNESLDISTSTMSMGIRGTSGYIGTNSSNSRAQIFTGGVEFIGPNGRAFIRSGQQVSSDNDFNLSQLNRDGSDIASMALKEINNNDSLKNEIKEKTDLDVDNFIEQEKINFQNEQEELLIEAKEINILKEAVAKEKEENKKSSTTNKSVTGKSSGGGSSKPALATLTWEILADWINKTTDTVDKIYGISDLVNFASGYSSNLNISGYNGLNEEGKEMVENRLLNPDDGIKGYLGYLLNVYNSLEEFTTAFNNAVDDANKEIPPTEILPPDLG